MRNSQLAVLCGVIIAGSLIVAGSNWWLVKSVRGGGSGTPIKVTLRYEQKGKTVTVPAPPLTPVPLLLLGYATFGFGSAMANPPITNTAVSGMPAARELREKLCDVLIESGDQDQAIVEMLGLEGLTPLTQEIFRFERRGRKGRTILGEFVATGVVPRLVEELRDRDIQVPMSLFQKPKETP